MTINDRQYKYLSQLKAECEARIAALQSRLEELEEEKQKVLEQLEYEQSIEDLHKTSIKELRSSYEKIHRGGVL